MIESKMIRALLFSFSVILALPHASVAQGLASESETPRPPPRDNTLPRTWWENRADGPLWTRVVIAAVETHGRELLSTVPKDIADWCPAYAENGPEDRAAFWAGFVSTLARYESTWNPRAVGGNGRWFGLMQIYPPTAEFRDCRVQTGAGLKRGSDNLNCAVRIMNIT
ncbi:MAG: transglycosylase SLT domain-containing protein, partial [Pseudomonadota bacterium]